MRLKSENISEILVDGISRPYLAIFVSLIIVSLVIPMLFFNVRSDPRLIPYFDLDEGYLRDLAWYIFSGEKLESFQYSLNYGIELYLMVDLLAKPLCLFMRVDSGTILFLIRLFHFMCGVASLIFFWKFIKRHFPSSWLPTLAVISMVILPDFSWWLDNAKPEPFLILLIILGLDYTLRILEEPSWKNLILAILFSSIAFTVKLLGLFLLPGIAISLYFAPLLASGSLNRKEIFKVFKQISQFSLGVLILILLFLFIAIPIGTKMYLSKKNFNFGLEQFAGTFKQTAGMTCYLFLILGLFVAIYLIVLLWLKHKGAHSEVFKKINVFPIFVLFSAIVGYRWTFNLFEVVITYGRWLHQQHTAPLNLFLQPSLLQFFTNLFINVKGWIFVVFDNKSLGVAGFVLLTLYFFMEIICKSWENHSEKKRFLKRIILLVYCIFLLFFLFLFQSRLAAHHIITINILLLLLGFEGFHIFLTKFKNKTKILLLVSSFYIAIFLINFHQRGLSTFKWRSNKLMQSRDVVFAVQSWWKKNIPYDTKIVADAPHYVYVPSEFKNVSFVQPRLFRDLSFKINPSNLRNIIEKNRPRLIFYNEGSRGGDKSPSLSIFLSDIKLKKIIEFTGEYFSNYCFKGDRFVVYEVTYDR